MKLTILWKTDNLTDIHNLVIPYAYNAKKHHWFDDVEVIIWGASQEIIKKDAVIQQRVINLIKNDIKVSACLMCADNTESTMLLESLGVIVKYIGEDLSNNLKNPDVKVITL